jgi:hypothetical protein
MNADGRRIDRKDAEQLLDAVAACPQPGPEPEVPDLAEASADPLARLLRTAAAPATTAELAGEEAAVTAFRAAAAPAPPGHPRVTRTSLFSTKVASVALAVTMATGMALASTTETLSLVWGPQRPPADDPTVPPSSGRAEQEPSGPTRSSPAPTVPPVPEPRTVRLCRTYTTAAQADPQAAHRTPAFATLVKKAGGSENVGGYCTQVLEAAARSGSPNSAGPSDNGGKDGNNENGNNGNKPSTPAKVKPSHPRGSPDALGDQDGNNAPNPPGRSKPRKKPRVPHPSRH